MASNSFGRIFRVTTWGESHGKAVGAIIDGCPSNIPLSTEDIDQELLWRQGGRSVYTTPRKEADKVEILSGVFEGKTTGAPISLIIYNQNVDSSKYNDLQHVLRPGHANYPYLKKYGIFDYKGGGRASGRETVCRVAAGAIAKKILKIHEIEPISFIAQIGSIQATVPTHVTRELVLQSPIFCPDPKASLAMEEFLCEVIKSNDSIGAIIESHVYNLPPGLGDPIYEKLHANLGKALLSIPACKGIEFGSGFSACTMKGSEHNDHYYLDPNGEIKTHTNHAGGLLGGISTGMPLQFRLAIKPTSSIRQEQPTLDSSLNPTTFTLPKGSRHDPCIGIRACSVVEAMTSIVLADALLMNHLYRS